MTTLRPKRFIGIQALRFFAATLVVITHSTFYTHERLDRTVNIWAQGTRGVDIFFVISGFVMLYSSQKLLGTISAGSIFLQRRFLRIVPLYWLLTSAKIFLLVTTAGLALHSVLSFKTVLTSYLFLPAKNFDGKIEPLIGVGWTLNFEMLFYYLFAAALFLRRNVFLVVGPVLLALTLGAFFRTPAWPTASAFVNPIVLEFLIGMLIAQLCLKEIYLPKMLAVTGVITALPLLLFGHDQSWVLAKLLMSGMPAALIVWSVASLQEMRGLVPAWMLFLGDASYSIYLIHPFVSPLPPVVMSRLHIHISWLSVVAGVTIGLGAGCLLHQFVELPLTKLLKGLMDRRSRHGEAPSREPVSSRY